MIVLALLLVGSELSASFVPKGGPGSSKKSARIKKAKEELRKFKEKVAKGEIVILKEQEKALQEKEAAITANPVTKFAQEARALRNENTELVLAVEQMKEAAAIQTTESEELFFEQRADFEREKNEALQVAQKEHAAVLVLKEKELAESVQREAVLKETNQELVKENKRKVETNDRLTISFRNAGDDAFQGRQDLRKILEEKHKNETAKGWFRTLLAGIATPIMYHYAKSGLFSKIASHFEIKHVAAVAAPFVSKLSAAVSSDAVTVPVLLLLPAVACCAHNYLQKRAQRQPAVVVADSPEAESKALIADNL